MTARPRTSESDFKTPVRHGARVSASGGRHPDPPRQTAKGSAADAMAGEIRWSDNWVNAWTVCLTSPPVLSLCFTYFSPASSSLCKWERTKPASPRQSPPFPPSLPPSLPPSIRSLQQDTRQIGVITCPHVPPAPLLIMRDGHFPSDVIFIGRSKLEIVARMCAGHDEWKLWRIVLHQINAVGVCEYNYPLWCGRTQFPWQPWSVSVKSPGFLRMTHIKLNLPFYSLPISSLQIVALIAKSFELKRGGLDA